jgi:hypothetical protein
MKKCSKCKIEKSYDNFHKDKTKKNGITSSCKDCHKIYNDNKRGYLTEEEKIKRLERGKLSRSEYLKKYNINNKERLLDYAKKYRESNSDKIKEYHKNNKDKRKIRNEKNKENLNNYKRIWYQNNKDKYKKYSSCNKEKRNYYLTNRRKIDYLFKLKCNVSSLIRQSITKKGYDKKSRTYQILGCTFEEFKQHLQNQFTKGMTWENQGKWHLDHIYPVSLAKNEEELIRLNHYTNFQPLWAKDNLIKSNKIINNIQLKLI